MINMVPIQWIPSLLLILASVCTFMIGNLYARRSQDSTIENTLIYLIEQGYLKSSTDEDGEIEILKLDE